jgi:signal transduction histidine kinase
MRRRAGDTFLGFPIGKYRGHIKLAIAAVGLAGTAMILASLWWNVTLVRRGILETARIQAGVAFEEDFTYRRWNALHGGVYVRASPGEKADVSLEGIPEREVVTTAGVRLALVTFAGMSREAHDLAEAAGPGVRGRLTSLRPLRTENRPDTWERRGLIALEAGAPDVHTTGLIEGREYLRLLKPLRNEAQCLGCHRGPGEAAGTLRGAASIAVPIDGLRAIERHNVRTLLLAHGALWAIGMAALLLGGGVFLRVEDARSAAERRLEERARELAASNRMKDLFADIMRHDLLNPAGVIGYYTDYLLEGQTDARARDSGLKIKRTVERLTQMIREAAQFTQLREADAIELRDLDLGVVVTDALGDLREGARREAVCLLFSASAGYPVRANPMVVNVFANLLTNAGKYGAGRIDVRIDDHRDWWTVSVADHGPGIADADKERIFCRFERIQKEGVKGSGLGLAIARHLVELHHGRIWVEDHPGGGACFKVRLPKCGPAAPRPAATPEKREPAGSPA